ncbi:hypothetical protein Mapa_001982 [Marchantia paleacea]|nr:hypothetical protein Mapa_001982 [Marchantia paleacea]
MDTTAVTNCNPIFCEVSWSVQLRFLESDPSTHCQKPLEFPVSMGTSLTRKKCEKEESGWALQ